MLTTDSSPRTGSDEKMEKALLGAMLIGGGQFDEESGARNIPGGLFSCKMHKKLFGWMLDNVSREDRLIANLLDIEKLTFLCQDALAEMVVLANEMGREETLNLPDKLIIRHRCRRRYGEATELMLLACDGDEMEIDEDAQTTPCFPHPYGRTRRELEGCPVVPQTPMSVTVEDPLLSPPGEGEPAEPTCEANDRQLKNAFDRIKILEDKLGESR